MPITGNVVSSANDNVMGVTLTAAAKSNAITSTDVDLESVTEIIFSIVSLLSKTVTGSSHPKILLNDAIAL